MEKVVNGKVYYMPSTLTSVQRAIYVKIIDWKRENITRRMGTYRGHCYDAIFPDSTTIPKMMYKPVLSQWEQMQKGRFAYKLHKFAFHAISSQTACVNLFMPMLLSEDADRILLRLPGCPSGFKRIARDRLFHGFCFEYWGQDYLQGTGILNDHSGGAGTDADVAIAYYDQINSLCLWLIEHKLSEKDFTVCGGYKSTANNHKGHCMQFTLSDILSNPDICHYNKLGYKYWDITAANLDKYSGAIQDVGCPFRGGLNQLWRNQILAFALQKEGMYNKVSFSVCHHAKNTMLDKSVGKYKALTNNNEMFTCFTNYDVLDAVSDTKDQFLSDWLQWYRDVYFF